MAQHTPQTNRLQGPRIGHGYDLHRLAPPEQGGKPMIIGGVRFDDHPAGPVGHSDGDVLLHALTDALLGAIGADDLGTLFPNTDAANEDRDSAEFVAEAVKRVGICGLRIQNIDCTVIAETPKLNPFRQRISEHIAGLLGVDPQCVNVKGKTHEGVDAVGRREAIEAHVVTVLMDKSTQSGG